MILFFDTETTGLPIFKAPSSDTRQPHIVQFAAIVTDNNLKEKSSINVICSPDGWEITKESSDIHGISHDDALKHGISEKSICDIYLNLISKSDLVVAHNISFDLRVMRIAMIRTKIISEDDLKNMEKSTSTYCTMESSSPIVNLPPTDRMISYGITKPKSPKLSEAIKFFFGEELDGAHNALVDVRACARLYTRLTQEEGNAP